MTEHGRTAALSIAATLSITLSVSRVTAAREPQPVTSAIAHVAHAGSDTVVAIRPADAARAPAPDTLASRLVVCATLPATR